MTRRRPTGKTRNRFLAYLRANGASGRMDLEDHFDVAPSTAYYHLNGLRSLGLVRMDTGSAAERSKNTLWEAVTP